MPLATKGHGIAPQKTTPARIRITLFGLVLLACPGVPLWRLQNVNDAISRNRRTKRKRLTTRAKNRNPGVFPRMTKMDIVTVNWRHYSRVTRCLGFLFLALMSASPYLFRIFSLHEHAC